MSPLSGTFLRLLMVTCADPLVTMMVRLPLCLLFLAQIPPAGNLGIANIKELGLGLRLLRLMISR